MIVTFLFSACEGPMGPSAVDGKDGKDANETCKLCHNGTGVLVKANEFKYSTHFTGDAFEEGTRAACAPCHSHQGFTYVVQNNIPSTIVVNSSDPARYINNYIAGPDALSFPGALNCFTCHSSLHTNYTATDFFPLTTTVAVPMTMYGGAMAINFNQTTSNLCAKCHQPRPITNSSGKMIDYSKLVSEPTAAYNMSPISFRTGVHYSSQGAIAAGIGGIEFGTGYTSSVHRTNASCTSCHMASPSGFTGGHSFVASGNFNGCNNTGCHSGLNATKSLYTDVVADVTGKLSQLGAKLDLIATPGIMQKNSITGVFTGNIDIYDPFSNATGNYRSPSTTGWTDDMKAYNNSLPELPSITNAQFGAIINFQLVLKDASNGIHNYPYIIKLLENSIAAI